MALAALVILLAGNLLYPDTSTDLSWKLGPVRISPLGTIFILTAPFIINYTWHRRHLLAIRTVDVLLVVTMFYMTTRGILAATNVNGMALTGGYAAYVLVLYYGTASLVQQSRAMKTISITLVCIGFIVIALGLAEFFLERNVLYAEIIKESVTPIEGKDYHRSGSTLGHPLALGLFLLQAAPFFVIYFARAGSYARRVAWGVAIVALVLTLLVTFSKGPWITAAAISSVVVIWLLWRKPGARKPAIMLIIAAILAVSLFSVVFYESTSAGTISRARKGESLNPRKYMWSRAPTVIWEHPVFGVGMWQSGPEATKVDYIDYGKHQPTAIDNLYLTILVDQGLLGAMLILATLASLFRQALELCQSGRRTAEWAIVLTASMSAVIICGLTMDSLLLWSGMVVFWLTAGMMRGLYELHRKKIEPVEMI